MFARRYHRRMGEGRLGRREFLRLAAAGSVCAVAAGAGCSPSSEEPKESGANGGPGAGNGVSRELRIAQWSAARAGIPGYDEWFDHQYTQRWGEQHGVRVMVEHLPLSELASRAEGEVAAQAGHDLFGLSAAPPTFEDHAIDHREIVEEVEAQLGKVTPLAKRSVLNPVTGKYFGFPEFWAPQVLHYRTDLWDALGSKPTSWEAVQRHAAALRSSGHPVGIGLSLDQESTYALLALLDAYGAALQDEDGRLTINSATTVEAVKAAASNFQTGMTDEVFTWDAVSDNRLLASGKGSFILNGVSAMRAVEAQDPALAAKVGLLPVPSGATPARSPYLMGVYVIWKFSPNVDLAKQFLVDLMLNYRDAFMNSQFYKMPAFPGAVPDLEQLVSSDPHAQPPGKYGLLTGAIAWSTNLGHPGSANAAVEEVLNRHLVPKMFAAAARRQLSGEDAVATAEAEMRVIFDKWRERGKI